MGRQKTRGVGQKCHGEMYTVHKQGKRLVFPAPSLRWSSFRRRADPGYIRVPSVPGGVAKSCDDTTFTCRAGCTDLPVAPGTEPPDKIVYFDLQKLCFLGQLFHFLFHIRKRSGTAPHIIPHPVSPQEPPYMNIRFRGIDAYVTQILPGQSLTYHGELVWRQRRRQHGYDMTCLF